MRLLSIREVLSLTGLARRTFFRYRENGTFPAPVRLDGCPRHVAWLESDVDAWAKANGIACQSHRDP